MFALRNLALFTFFLLVLSSCRRFKEIQVDLSKEINEIELIPNRYLTTKCDIRLTGKSDCDIQIQIPGKNSLFFPKGVIAFQKRFEWYDEGNKLIILSDGCSDSSTLILEYRYSAQYWN